MITLTTAPEMTATLVVRRPPAEVFAAFADPAITTRFWFNDSTGRLEPGAELVWTWSMFDVSVPVSVRECVPGERIVMTWGEPATRVEWSFEPTNVGTRVTVRESGYAGDGDAVVAAALDSMGGFTTVLVAAKALLEHDVVVAAVRDK